MTTINILGKNVEIARLSQDRYTFGESGPQHHFLHEGGEILGFVNAVADVMDGLYAICESGFHSKVDWDGLALETEAEARAYVNFDMLTNKNTIERLAEQGITKRHDKHGWLVLNTKWGRFYPSHYANPKTPEALYSSLGLLPEGYSELNRDEQKAARKATRLQVHPDTINRNEHEWAICHKHNGVSLVLLVMAGKRVVDVTHRPTKGFEWRERSIESKIVSLFEGKETRIEKRIRIVNNMNERATVARGGFYVRKYGELEARVDEAVSEQGLFAFTKEGELVEIEPTDLIKRTFYLFQGEQKKHDRFAFDLTQVKGIIAFAMDRNFSIHLG